MKKGEIGGTSSTHSKHEKCIQNSGRVTFRKEQLWRPKPKWKNDIKMKKGKIFPLLS
jgi:hypothetical protein